MARSNRAGYRARWPRAAGAVSCAAAIGLLAALAAADHDSRLVFGTDTSALTGSHSPAEDGEARLFVDPVLLGKLQTLADGLGKEIVLCLTGDVSDGFGHATDFVMPAVHVSTPTSSSVDACPEETVAVWHNHSVLGTALAQMTRTWNGVGARVDPAGISAQLCRLSERDMSTLVESDYPFAVISVDRDTWCWWSRDQVVEFARTGEPTGPPIEGQIRIAR